MRTRRRTSCFRPGPGHGAGGGERPVRGEPAKDLPLAPTDLCALLGNALDNALEAARRTPEGWVSVRARADKGLLMLRVENSAPGLPCGRKTAASPPPRRTKAPRLRAGGRWRLPAAAAARWKRRRRRAGLPSPSAFRWPPLAKTGKVEYNRQQRRVETPAQALCKKKAGFHVSADVDAGTEYQDLVRYPEINIRENP